MSVSTRAIDKNARKILLSVFANTKIPRMQSVMERAPGADCLARHSQVETGRMKIFNMLFYMNFIYQQIVQIMEEMLNNA